jgi:hypothetical protein
LRAELLRYPGTAHRSTYYFLLNHTRRTIGCWFQLYYFFGHIPCLPYGYYPLFFQGFEIEPKHYFDGWMQHRCMMRVNPDAARFPTTRNPVPASYRVDRTDAAIARAQYLARHVRFRNDAKQMFPKLKRHLLVFEALSRVGFQTHRRAPLWAAQLVGRTSRFLSWLEDRDTSRFPV